MLPKEVSANDGRWDNRLFPFLVEIMDCLAPWHPAEVVTFVKSAQVGGTEVGLNWMFAIADMWPGPTLMVHPTIQAAQDWGREKLAPSLRATDRVRNRVIEQRSRDGASTTLFKSFPGGFWALAGSNSAATLSSKSIRFLIKEEWDRWVADVDGQGDPDKLAEARLISYHASGRAKIYQPSTPTILGVSRIWAAWEAGDKRRYWVPCPHCGAEQVLRFFPDGSGRGGLRFAKENTADAAYACEACGALVEHHHKRDMLARGRWVAEKPGQGRQPSFHINALYSPVTTWAKMAGEFVEAEGDPQKLKAFVNLWLGEPWEERGEAPDWKTLFARRVERAAGVLPIGAVALTGGADVQADGIYYEIVAWDRERRSWTVDAGFLEGVTAESAGKVWQDLDRVWRRTYRTVGGVPVTLDGFAVDSGYQSGTVYDWTKRRPKTYAVKGIDGWYHPPLATPKKVDRRLSGKIARNSAKVWMVGTWSLKATLYADLRKLGHVAGAEADPPGYCHFATFQGEEFFKQLTAEHLRKRELRGKVEQDWHASGPNHFLDCRVYAKALAEFLFHQRFTSEEWADLEAQRGGVIDDAAPDLFTPAPRKVAVAAEPTAEPSSIDPTSAAEPASRAGRRGGFLSRNRR